MIVTWDSPCPPGWSSSAEELEIVCSGPSTSREGLDLHGFGLISGDLVGGETVGTVLDL